jgi:hypothetical protein
MFFDHLDERNAMLKSVIYFDNFTRWTFFVVNTKVKIAVTKGRVPEYNICRNHI